MMVDTTVLSVKQLLSLGIKFSLTYLCKRRIIDPDGYLGKKISDWTASAPAEVWRAFAIKINLFYAEDPIVSKEFYRKHYR